jgi:hypothetical protein
MHVLLMIQKTLQSLSNDLMIVHEKNTEWHKYSIAAATENPTDAAESGARQFARTDMSHQLGP